MNVQIIRYESERKVTVTQSCPTLCNPMDCSLPGSSSMEFSRQEYWSGWPFPSPGDLPNSGIEPGSPALQADSLPSETVTNLIKVSSDEVLSLSLALCPSVARLIVYSLITRKGL